MAREEEYKRLRKLLNPAIHGPNTDAVLWALASGTEKLIDNVEAVHDQIYIATAEGRYLDQRLADANLIRPPTVGLSDDVFRDIGISVLNTKQIRDLILKILGTMFGEDAIRATSISGAYEPYNLDDGDTLIIQYDGADPITITFESSQFANINTATAQEVADAITRSIRKQGKIGSAVVKDDGTNKFVELLSNTPSPSSSIKVLGGKAQNVLLFREARPTSATASTQWTVSAQAGGIIRYTWSGGANPSVGKVRKNDYVNIYGPGFNNANRGTFTVIDVRGGSVNNAYFEIENPNGVSEIAVQGTNNGVLFFNPYRMTILDKTRYAAVYQAEQRLLEILIPATTKVVRRDKAGAAHIHGSAFITTTTYNDGQNQVTDITFPSPGAISDGQYFLLNTPTTLYYVYFDTTGGNLVDPAIPGRTGIRINISSLTTATQVAQEVAKEVSGTIHFSAANPSTPTARIANADVGAITPHSNGNVPGISFSVYQTGVNASVVTTSVPNPDEQFTDNFGPYLYDPSQPFTISDKGSTLTAQASPTTNKIIQVANANNFPDSQGFIILGYGTSRQEGPIPYLARPSSNSLLLNPSYRIKNTHPVGTDVALVASNGPVIISKTGTDLPFYLTDVVAGRVYAEDLIKMVVATGIRLVITILYPGDEGLSKWGTKDSETPIIWGP
jgi:hypothetical protein